MLTLGLNISTLVLNWRYGENVLTLEETFSPYLQFETRVPILSPRVNISVPSFYQLGTDVLHFRFLRKPFGRLKSEDLHSNGFSPHKIENSRFNRFIEKVNKADLVCVDLRGWVAGYGRNLAPSFQLRTDAKSSASQSTAGKYDNNSRFCRPASSSIRLPLLVTWAGVGSGAGLSKARWWWGRHQFAG